MVFLESHKNSFWMFFASMALKTVEWILDKKVNMSGVSTWQGVEDKLAQFDAQTLRDIYASKVADSNIPRAKAQKISGIVGFLQNELKH